MTRTDDSGKIAATASPAMLNWLLLGGIVVRLAVLLTASPFDADNHYQVIQYIAALHRLPPSNLLPQSFHPPLYYLLMAPLYMWWNDSPPIHFLSFVFSALTLLIIWRVARRSDVLADPAAKNIAFAFACFLPQFVMFSSFISNDTLTILVGSLLFAASLRYLDAPSLARLALLGLIAGIGLLTKGTFLLTPLALAIVVGWIELRRRGRRAWIGIAMFCAISGGVGCYKYVENVVNFGHPIVHNLDSGNGFLLSQRGVWKGARTIFDVNLIKLIRRPVLQPSSTFSYPLLFYATLWYPHMVDSSYRGNVSGYAWVGSLIYALAIAPTLVFLIGVARAIWIIAAGPRWPRDWLIACAIAMLLSNFAVVMAAGVKYDLWSCFQSRLCFQSFLPMMLLFSLGMETLPRSRPLRSAIIAICWATIACCLLYFAVEIPLAISWLPPGTPVQP